LGDLDEGTVRPLLFHPDPRLRLRCEPAGFLSGAKAQALVRDLLATMYAAGGRGLAAPQIGVMRRIFVMDAGWKDGAPMPLVMVDPEILAWSADWAVDVENCLSIPGKPVAMRRAVTIQMGCFDLDGLWHRHHLSGPAARIAQHEADHLDGRLIVDLPP
jgi:peptide deformylase